MSVASEIIHDVLSNPTEKFHKYQILIDEKEEILAELQEFCDKENYHLSVAYYDNKDANLIKIRLIKITDEDDEDDGYKYPAEDLKDHDHHEKNTIRYLTNTTLIIGFIIGGMAILGYYASRN